MAARTETLSLQLTWVEGAVAAWQPGHGVYGGNLHQAIAQVGSLKPVTISQSTRVVPLHLPDGRVNVMVQHINPASLASLGHRGALRHDVSPSVAWFGAIHQYAETLVARGRVAPELTHLTGNWWQALWRPFPVDVEAARALLEAMPPVVAAHASVDPVEVLLTAVDHLTRTSLAREAWYAPLTEVRTINARAVKAATKALTSYTGQFTLPDELFEPVRHIAGLFRQLQMRADGQPVVQARLRLGVPEPVVVVPSGLHQVSGAEGSGVDELEPPEHDPGWPLTLELFDVDDRSRWCTAADVTSGANGNAIAAALAREPRFHHVLVERLAEGAKVIGAAVPSLVPWLESDEPTVCLEHAADVLESVEALRAAGIELMAPEGLVRRRTSSRAVAQPTDTQGSGRFAATALVNWQVVVDGQAIDEQTLKRAAEAGANLIQVGGRWVQVDRAEAKRALATLHERQADRHEMSALELLELAAELERELEAAGLVDDMPPEPPVRGFGWARDLLAGLPDTEIADGVVPPGFTATLRPYQRRGLGWLQFLRGLGLGGCLADDMGLGKTPTTLAHLASLEGPHLVVCPLSVVRNWQSEAARFVPGMRVMVHHGASRADSDEFANEVALHQLVITTYQIAARDLEALQRVAWSTVVLDEAQAVKNPDTRAARAMRAITAQQRIALTGTPIENRLSELWSIFNIVTPGLLGSSNQFRGRFAMPIEKRRDPAATAALRTLTSPFLLRRTKADKSLVPDLPPKVEQVAWAPLTREQAQLYQAVVDQLLIDSQQATGMKRRGLVLAALTRLKQICNHPAHALADGSKIAGRSGKLHRFDELVADLLDAGEQALVFTQFREMGVILQQHLHERFGQRVPFLHGGVSKNQRDRMVAEFQNGSAVSPLLLVSLKAGGVGLNLTAASQVVHFDRWWNPAVEDQATDRAWRIGQERTVFVHKLVCEGTVEERIDALINDKRGLASAVVGSTGEEWLSELSTDDLRSLVQLDLSKARPT